MLRRKSSTAASSNRAQPSDQEGSNQGVSKSTSNWKLFDKFKLPIPPLKSQATNQITEATQENGNTKPPLDPSTKERYVKNCQCCGTIVSYLGTTDKFLCSICNTKNIVVKNRELSPEPSTYPHVLSFRYVRRILDQCIYEADEANRQGQPKSAHEVFGRLSDYLLAAFSSYPCLNNSFKIKKSSKKLHYSTSNLNVEDIKNTFYLLTNLPTKRPLYNALSGASELLQRIEVSLDSDARSLYWLLILLEIPFLSHALVNYERPLSTKHSSMIDVTEIKSLCYDILKRVFGILANSNETASNNYIASWFSKLNRIDFMLKVDLVNLYITFHLKKYYYIANNPQLSRRRKLGSSSSRDHEYQSNIILKQELGGVFENDNDAPTSSHSPFAQSSNPPSNQKRSKSKKDQGEKIKIHQYGTDWHLKTSVMFLATFIKANSIRQDADKLPVSVFYNSLVDFVNIKLDFDMWQNKKKLKNKPGNETSEPELQTVIDYIRGSRNSFDLDGSSFFFCQYPYLISLGGKISILEYEARRQMERKAEEAFINSLDKRMAIDVYFKVRIRREYIVQDSLRCIKLNAANLKKSLRVQFINEPGIDAGGIKKEWFLLLTKSLFSPQAGMFANIEDSNLLWFNIVPIEDYEMYYLFGAILGLAMYNSTILNLKFPIALYKLLLGRSIDLEDYEQLYPVSATNLLKLRTYNDDELKLIDLAFEVSYTDLLGKVHSKELITNGSNVSVTVENRDFYIEKYSKFFMCDGMMNQIKFFTKGFSNVIGGNALSLFLPQEIELLLCGSEEEKIDIAVLRSVTKYVGWKDHDLAANSSVVRWFWNYMENLSSKQHKLLLAFVTGSDRVPATGVQNLNFRISRLANGRDTNRLPIAHTCFNELALYEYSTPEKLVSKLNTAIYESSGFGIK